MQVYHREQTIAERADGRWLNYQTGRYYQTAVAANRAVTRSDRQITESNPASAVVTTVTWITRTRAGLDVVMAITNANRQEVNQ